MKKIINNILALLIIAFAVTSCESGDFMPDTTVSNMGVFKMDANSDLLIGDESFKAKFEVSLYYPKDVPTDARLVMIKNADAKNIKVFKESVTTFPTTIELTYDEIVSQFGTIELGDKIELGLDIKMGSTWHLAFGPDGSSTVAPDAEDLNGSTPTVSFKKVCPLVLDDFVGTVSITDANLYGGTYKAEIVKNSETELEIRGFIEEAAPSGIVKLTINPKDHSVAVSKQVFIIGDVWDWGYHNMACVGKGTIDACNGAINLSLTVSVDEGTFGTWPMTIKN